jgi:predicted SprT family Zn-dependent metalloprotease
MTSSPTTETYLSLDDAFTFFNARLFENRLPVCLITLQRHRSAYGFFWCDKFNRRADTEDRVDEIALNPSHFRERTIEQSLSTLVHEMTHLEQHHFGKPSRNGYHNKAWGVLMKAVGLFPSSTGAHGGKETGQKVRHYVIERGLFATACRELLERGFSLDYVERLGDVKETKKRDTSKTKFTCPQCEANAWAKLDAHLVCGECDERMLSEGGEEGDD